MTLSTATAGLIASTLGTTATRCTLAAALTKRTVSVATTISVLWMGPRTSSPVAPVLIGPGLTQGTTSKRGVSRSSGRAKGSTNPAGEEGGEESSSELKGGVRRLGTGLVV